MSHKHGGAAGPEHRRRMSRTEGKQARKGESEGGTKVLLKRLVTTETAPTPLLASRANWLSSLASHAQALALYLALLSLGKSFEIFLLFPPILGLFWLNLSGTAHLSPSFSSKCFSPQPRYPKMSISFYFSRLS